MASRAKSLMRTSAANRKRHLAFTLLLGMAAGSISGCGPKSAAENSVVHFHALYNAGKGHAIYELLEEGDPEGTHEGAMIEKVDFIRGTVGNVQTSDLTDFYQQELLVDEPHVKLTYRTKFDSGTGTETFWFQILKGHAVMLNWQVDSPEVLERVRELDRPH